MSTSYAPDTELDTEHTSAGKADTDTFCAVRRNGGLGSQQRSGFLEKERLYYVLSNWVKAPLPSGGLYSTFHHILKVQENRRIIQSNHRAERKALFLCNQRFIGLRHPQGPAVLTWLRQGWHLPMSAFLGSHLTHATCRARCEGPRHLCLPSDTVSFPAHF